MAADAGFYPIEGIQDGLDPNKQKLLREVPLRMELDDWYQSPQLLYINQRALFFPAFWRFSQANPKKKLSWFQIAGIHGKPFVAWDEPPQKPATNDKGYCTHNSILFCTWHRPYLLLFEQVIYELMKEEVQKYTLEERPALLEAARTWRFPYWDWAAKKPLPENSRTYDYNVPLVVLTKEVRIRLPTVLGYGLYPNAFYQFTMPKGITMGDHSLQSRDEDPLKDLRITKSEVKYHPPDGSDPFYVTVHFESCKATSRYPIGAGVTKAWEDGSQDNAAIAKALRDYKWDPVKNTEDAEKGNLTASLRDAYYRLLTISKFEDFATKRAPGTGAKKPAEKDFAFDSSENLHDNVHFWCGGPVTKPDFNRASQMGHMSHVPLAAFDPIFWVHHWQVQQSLYTWFDGSDPRDEDLGTFAIEKYHHDKPSEDLRPFHKDRDGHYWTSNDAREVTALGYTYPGLEKWKYRNLDGSYDQATHIKELTRTLNTDYNSAWSAVQKARLTADPNTDSGLKLQSLSSLIAATHVDPVDIHIDDYVVNVIYEKFALNGTSFTIHIFVGKVPDQLPYSFQEPGTQVGEIFNFSTEPGSAGNSPAGCQNCRNQQHDHSKSTGRVVLTNALITRFKNRVPHEPDDDGPRTLAGMEPHHVVPFLKSNFHWRVTSMGTLLDPEAIPSLKVSVAVGKASHYADRTKLSEFHDYKGAFEVTQGRPGGAGPEDGLYPPDAVYVS
ncbi:MAG: hypothetical protein Q9167_007463 [Letrouitia subvulpina]